MHGKPYLLTCVCKVIALPHSVAINPKLFHITNGDFVFVLEPGYIFLKLEYQNTFWLSYVGNLRWPICNLT